MLVLIRPHPERRREWEGVSLDNLGPVVVYGQTPFTPEAKSDYYHGLVHSGAVVGLVTSAFLEAAIVGRPVLSVLRPELEKHQEGMLHFRYLLDVEGGLLKVARGLDEHLPQLAQVLDGGEEWAEQQRKFLRAFVRPQGLEVRATDVFVDAVEKIGNDRPSAVCAAVTVPRLRPVVNAIIARSESGRLVRSLLFDVREAEYQRVRSVRLAEHARDKRRLKRERRKDRTARERVKAEARRHALARKGEVDRAKRREKRARVRNKQRHRAREYRRQIRGRLTLRVKRLIGLVQPTE